MSAGVNEASVEKRLKNLNGTQESIQSLSLWAIHHKAAHDKLCEIWFKVLKKSKIEHRLVLFYLCNDIVQTCKRKHAIMYKDAFKDVLQDAALLVREASIRPNIERIFNIWKERGVYDAEFVDELKAVLNNTKVRAVAESKLVTEFKPAECMEKIITLKRNEDEVEMKRKQLQPVKIDTSNVEAVKQLKDRTQGKEFCSEYETGCKKMEDYVEVLTKEIQDRTALIEMLEQSELYYDAQYGEAKIVANAYKNFGSRVNSLRKRLVEHAKSITATGPPSPVPSPTVDAPSPGNTPPQTGEDCLQTVDMELDDDPPPPPPDSKHAVSGGGRRRDNTSVTGALSRQPIASVTHITITSKPTSSNNEEESYSPASDDDFEAPVWKPGVTKPDDNDDASEGTPKASPIADSPGSFTLKTLAQSSSFSSSGWEQIPIEEDIPVTDDGGATPTMDENLPQEKPPNPIDFLTQLINKKTVKQGIDRHFFRNLSLLSKTVKSQYNDGPNKSEGSSSSERDSKPVWSSDTTEWKADKVSSAWTAPQPVAPAAAGAGGGGYTAPYTGNNYSQPPSYQPPPQPEFTTTSQAASGYPNQTGGQNYPTGGFSNGPPPPPQAPPPPVPPVGATAESPPASFMSPQQNQPAAAAPVIAGAWGSNGGNTNAYGQATPPSPLAYPAGSVNPLTYGQQASTYTSPPNPVTPTEGGFNQNPPNFQTPYSPTNPSPTATTPATAPPAYGSNAPPPPNLPPAFSPEPEPFNRNLTSIPMVGENNGTSAPQTAVPVDSQPINTLERQMSGGDNNYEDVSRSDGYGPGKHLANLRPLTHVNNEDMMENRGGGGPRRLSMEEGPRGQFVGPPPPPPRYPPPQNAPRSPFPQQRPPRFSPYPPNRPRDPYFRDARPYGPPPGRGMRPQPPRRFPPPRPNFHRGGPPF